MPPTPRSTAAPRGVRSDAGARQEILAAALTCFAARGFGGATTRQIAAAAGVNQGLITYYFGSKEELWRATVDRVFDELRRVLGDLREAADAEPIERLRRLVRRFVEFSAARPELHRLMVQEGTHDGPRLRWLIETHVRPLYAAMLALVAGAQRDGTLPNIPAPHLHYIFLGAAAHIFVVAPEFRRLAGADPLAPDFVAAHADALVALLTGASAGGRAGARGGSGCR